MVGRAISTSYKNAEEVPWSQLDAHSCRYCQSVTVDLKDRLESSEIDEGGIRKWELPIRMSLSQVVDAALNGCVLCDWLVEQMLWSFNTPQESDDFAYISIVFEYGRDVHDIVSAQFFAVQKEQAIPAGLDRRPLLKRAFRNGDLSVFDPTRFEVVVTRGT